MARIYTNLLAGARIPFSHAEYANFKQIWLEIAALFERGWRAKNDMPSANTNYHKLITLTDWKRFRKEKFHLALDAL